MQFDFSARLRQPQDGLFSGHVDAVNTQDNTYRITFDRQGNHPIIYDNLF